MSDCISRELALLGSVQVSPENVSEVLYRDVVFRVYLEDLPPAQPEPSEEWRKKHYEQSYNQGFVDACKMFERRKDIPLSTDDIFDAELAKRILNNK